MAIPSKNVLGNPNVTEGNFQIAIEQLRESVIGSGKTYDNANTYMAYDICYYNGVVYYSKIDNNIGNTPSIGANWGDIADLISGVVHKTGDTMTGNLNFAIGTKITGDFSNAVHSSRVAFQTNVTNGVTSAFFIPNGTGAIGQVVAGSSSDASNTSYISMVANGSEGTTTINSGRTGTGTALPLTFVTNSNERMRIDTAGNVLVTGSGGLGYGTGSGGTVTQLTSKSTAVTLNKPSGQITMNSAALAAGASVIFQFSNSLLTSGDNIYVELGTGISGWNNYRIECAGRVSENVVMLRLTNISGASLSESQVIKFSIIKGANS